MPTPQERLLQEAPYDSLTLEDSTKLAKYPYSTIVTVESKNGGMRDQPNPDNRSIPDLYPIEVFANEFLSTYGSDNEYITCTVLELAEDVLSLDLGHTVTVRLPRFDLQDGKLYRIVGITYQLRERKITFNLWGGDTTPYTYSASMGYSGPDEYWAYVRVENDGIFPDGAVWAGPPLNRALQRPYSQYQTGVQWQYICLVHKLTTRSAFPDDQLVTHTYDVDSSTSTPPSCVWYPADGVSTTVSKLNAENYTGVASPLWLITVTGAGILHFCSKLNLQLKVTVTPNASFGLDYTWEYIYWPPPSPDTRAYTGTSECWVYGSMADNSWNQLGVLSNPIVLYTELERPYPDYTSNFVEISGVNSPMYFVHKVVSRSGGVVVSATDDVSNTLVTDWKPYYPGGTPPTVVNVAVDTPLSGPSCLWKVTYVSDGFLTVNSGGNLELVIHMRMDPTSTWVIATWQYVYYDPTATPDPDPPNPPEFIVHEAAITESVTPTDTTAMPEISWGIAESVAATAAATVNASDVTRTRQELVFATDTPSVNASNVTRSVQENVTITASASSTIT